jgi:pimeloyl-ACP methyl ester carboxylesterase
MRDRQRAAGIVCLLTCLGVGGCAALSTGPANRHLELKELGVFFVGGNAVESPYSDGRGAKFPTTGRSTVTGQARITFLKPAHASGVAIVLVPGFGLGSSIYLSTPDGREGWAQAFVRSGHPVYVVDLPGRGSSAFAIDGINGCLMGATALKCSPAATRLGRTSLEQPWNTWGFGPRYRERYPDSRFPATLSDELYAQQFGASFEVFVEDGSEGPAVARGEELRALRLLLDRIGPAVLIMHSAAGTAAEFVSLPDDRNIKGNSHLMMQDDNNLVLAGMILAWLGSHGIR